MSLMTESSLKQAIAQVAATRAVEWRVSDAPVVYPDAMAVMDARVDDIARGEASECVWQIGRAHV